MKTKKQKVFPPLEEVTARFVPTEAAAFYLGRKAQTLRTWACGARNSTIKPRRIGGQWGWNVAELKQILGVEETRQPPCSSHDNTDDLI